MRFGAGDLGVEPATFYKAGYRIILKEVASRCFCYKWYLVERTVEEREILIDSFLKANDGAI